MYEKIYDKLENEGYSSENSKKIFDIFRKELRCYGKLNNEQIEDILEVIQEFESQLEESENATNVLYRMRDYLVNSYKSTAIGEFQSMEDISIIIMESNRYKEVLCIYDSLLAM